MKSINFSHVIFLIIFVYAAQPRHCEGNNIITVGLKISLLTPPMKCTTQPGSTSLTYNVATRGKTDSLHFLFIVMSRGGYLCVKWNPK